MNWHVLSNVKEKKNEQYYLYYLLNLSFNVLDNSKLIILFYLFLLVSTYVNMVQVIAVKIMSIKNLRKIASS